jgi:glycosyltransferase involved in cell wall biosynthesis
MEKKDTVCIAITKSNMGGAQKYVLLQAEEFLKQGKDVVVLSGGEGILFDELSQKGIRFIKLKQSQRDISIFKEIKLFFELFKILSKIKPDILYLHSSKIGLIGSVVGRLLGISEIIFVAHGWAFNEKRPGWQKFLFYFFYWITILLSNKTICVSNKSKEQISFLPFIKNKLEVKYTEIPNLNFYEKEQARKLLKEKFNFLDLNKKWIVVLAELHYTKGHDILFDALKLLKEKLSNHQIVCIGSGDRESELRKIVTDKFLKEIVFFTGFLNKASEYLKAFDLLILPSRTEALPLVLLEAKKANLFIIASNVGGIPEIVTSDEVGVLFEKENIEDLKNKLLEKLKL